ncbi:YfiT family bacillithiol transferase [Evansella cellulosilytica]|uniref:Putative metal-dependent hydrolase Bcell_2071 n=1 Tax=Evansella cellulosilytica (strain ATCC 21833 / DSM 2522 / FERM P-1141 / JCM 9156 / N-4) TaxID=649639 RepID=E6U121_EVAC2|nr:bacillithiol transferase BstA [Evansella cellulosilytica]ADU30333.1 metal-dependent hydrolase [Evansella cellulosilytica DSM 2522]
MDMKYPIGMFQFDGEITNCVTRDWIIEIEELPSLLRNAVKDFDDEQLDTPYRPEGWTVRQVIHHLADSHLNAYVRFKLALTEEEPIIKPYDEAKWAELSDYKIPIDISLSLLEALHKRWTMHLQDLSASDLKKTFIHPDSGVVSVGENIGIYAWHGRHHLAHITSLRKRKGW